MNWQLLQEYYAARTLRERILISVTVLCAVWGLWMISIGGHLLDRREAVERDLHSVLTQIRQERSAHALEARRLPDYRNRINAKNALEQNVQAQEREIELLLAQYVEPAQINRLLSDLLRRHQGVELVNLSNGQATEITVAGVPSGVFRHPVRLEFDGGYVAVYRYLQDLEAQQSGLSWRRLDYVVQEYPRARVVIELESLSRQPSWIGV